MQEILGCTPASMSLDYYWKEMDYVAGNIDTAYCGQSCPCDLTNKTGFEEDPDIQGTYSKYNIQNAASGGKIMFQNCSDSLKAVIQHESSNETAFGNFTSSINLWNVFEESFNCTGWCKTTYPNADFNETTNTCMGPDKISPCNCTDISGKACTSCVDKSDNRSECKNYIRPVKSIEKYLFTDINK